MKLTSSSALLTALAIAGFMPASLAHAGETLPKKKPLPAVATPDPVQERYQELMDHADGAARSCSSARLPLEKAHALIARFAKAVRFVDISLDQPVKVELPEDFYHPMGRVVTFDKAMLTVSREDPHAEYISMMKTADGVRLEVKIAVTLAKNSLHCVGMLSATIPYKPAAPTKTGEEAPVPSS